VDAWDEGMPKEKGGRKKEAGKSRTTKSDDVRCGRRLLTKKITAKNAKSKERTTAISCLR